MRNIKRVVAVVACGPALVLAGAALAAEPQVGRYVGHTSAAPVNGFLAPVKFKFTGGGLSGFRYSTGGCFGFGGQPMPGVNYWKKPWNLKQVGSVPVSGKNFSVSNVKSTYVGAYSLVTTTSVSGRFTAGKAKGTIAFRQTETYSGRRFNCGPVTLTFTAKHP